MLDLSKLVTGLKGRAEVVVGPQHLATRIGSGRVDVYGSPMMIALMEAACGNAIDPVLPEGTVSLGTHLDVAHIAATPIGHNIAASAELIKIDGRSLTFKIEARDEKEVIGRGTHTRMVVDTRRFQAKLATKAKTGS